MEDGPQKTVSNVCGISGEVKRKEAEGRITN